MESTNLRTMGWTEWRRRTSRCIIDRIVALLEKEGTMDLHRAIRQYGWLSQIGVLLLPLTTILPECVCMGHFQIVINEVANFIEYTICKAAEEKRKIVSVIQDELQAQDDHYFSMMDCPSHDLGLKDTMTNQDFIDALMDKMTTPTKVGQFISTLQNVFAAYEGS